MYDMFEENFQCEEEIKSDFKLAFISKSDGEKLIKIHI